MKDIFPTKVIFPAPAPLSFFPLLDRLLVFSLKAWGSTRGSINSDLPAGSNGFCMLRWNGQEYSQRPVYRGPASSVLYFSEQPTYSCWMVSSAFLG